ncbi:MAG: hypothetical protein UV60_C0006G0095 [Parcubacteria group bacterium GW2011_GWA2_43_11]|nr:MAG: hypothetical protein UV60_C0006G0095 [Parcubacteria group bacterium GW2011_GWA2_43_11]
MKTQKRHLIGQLINMIGRCKDKVMRIFITQQHVVVDLTERVTDDDLKVIGGIKTGYQKYDIEGVPTGRNLRTNISVADSRNPHSACPHCGERHTPPHGTVEKTTR